MQKLMARACWLAGCRAAELQVKCRVLGVAQGPPPGPLPSHRLLGTSGLRAFELPLACHAAYIPGCMVHPEPGAWEGWLGDRVHLAPCLGAGPMHQNYVAHSCCFIWLRPIQPPSQELPLLVTHAVGGSTLPRKIVHWAGGLHVGGASRWGGGAARGAAASMGQCLVLSSAPIPPLTPAQPGNGLVCPPHSHMRLVQRIAKINGTCMLACWLQGC